MSEPDRTQRRRRKEAEADVRADVGGEADVRADVGGEADVRADVRADVSDDRADRICRATLQYARERGYTGWDYADGLSSAFVQSLPFEHRWLNLLVQEGIKRAPINLRPLFLVEQRRNYKGAALFVLANLDLFALSGEDQNALSGEDRYAREAEKLVEWLLAAEVDGYSGFCGGGHRHPLQSLDRPGASTPGEVAGVVSTSYAVRALLRYAEMFDKPVYADYARTAAEFVRTDLDFTEIEEGARIDYTTTGGDSYTLNANALGARLLVDLYDRFGDPDLLADAEAILDYVATKQTTTGGWMYTDPPTASHLSMDSYHNGFILESLLHYREVTGNGRYDATIDRARSFYRGLFRADGAPDWDESSAYPRDVHAAAQGIVTFSYLGEFALARTIFDWTLENLYAGDGRFYYQQRRFYTKRFTLMRWCQAWMAYALSTYLTEKYER